MASLSSKKRKVLSSKKRNVLRGHLHKLANSLSQVDQEISDRFTKVGDWLVEEEENSFVGISTISAALDDALKSRPAKISDPAALVQNEKENVEEKRRFFKEYLTEEKEIVDATTAVSSIKHDGTVEGLVEEFLREYANPESFWGKFSGDKAPGNAEPDGEPDEKRIILINDALDHFTSSGKDIARRILNLGLHEAIQKEINRVRAFGGSRPAVGQSYRDLALQRMRMKYKGKPAPRHVTASEKWSTLEPGVVVGFTTPNWTLWDRNISSKVVAAVNAYLEFKGTMPEYRKASGLVKEIQSGFGSKKRKLDEELDSIQHPNNRPRLSTDLEDSPSASFNNSTTENVRGIRNPDGRFYFPLSSDNAQSPASSASNVQPNNLRFENLVPNNGPHQQSPFAPNNADGNAGPSSVPLHGFFDSTLGFAPNNADGNTGPSSVPLHGFFDSTLGFAPNNADANAGPSSVPLHGFFNATLYEHSSSAYDLGSVQNIPGNNELSAYASASGST